MLRNDHSKAPLIIGKEALKVSGMQLSFAKSILAVIQHFNIAISFRAGNPPDYDSARAPKSGLNLSKTANHGLGKSLIAVDPELTKLGANQVPVGHHEKDAKKLNENKQLTTQLSRSFREILENTQPAGDMEFSGYNGVTHELFLKYKEGRGPAGFNGVFKIPLSKGETIEKHYSRPWNIPTARPKMPYGLSPDLLDKEFPIEYSSAPSGPFKPFEVFAADVAEPGEAPDIRPITGDWDILTIGHPHKDLLGEGREKIVYNSFIAEEKTILIEETEALFNALKQKFSEKNANSEPSGSLKDANKPDIFESVVSKFDFSKIYDQYAFDRAGCSTPFEFLKSRVLNLLFKDPNIKNLLQHGPENRNPYKPSDLEGNMLHFYKNQITLTRTEDELIQFYLAGDYLKDNHIDVHPGWPMEKWGPVIERQVEISRELKLKPSIPPGTWKAYQDYKRMRQSKQTQESKTLVLERVNGASRPSTVSNLQRAPSLVGSQHNPITFSYALKKQLNPVSLADKTVEHNPDVPKNTSPKRRL